MMGGRAAGWRPESRSLSSKCLLESQKKPGLQMRSESSQLGNFLLRG